MSDGNGEESLYDAIERLSEEVKRAGARMGPQEARYLVDTYYAVQELRKAVANQTRMMTQGRDEGEPVLVGWLTGNMGAFEGRIKRVLQAYAEGSPVGQWSLGITGIGPVISAGLLAHIDIARAPTAGQIWRYAGLDPSMTWEKGQKRPWNASLKVLAWKAGESFVKVSGHRDNVYGKVYAARKAWETAQNEAGAYAEQAAEKLRRFNIGKDTDAYAAYSAGKLPPAHVHARAKRFAVKLFLSHWHHVAYDAAYGVAPEPPWIFTEHAARAGLGGHTHLLPPPSWPVR